jgi:hypothetical protein
MSAAVRRMVCDVQFRWLALVVLLMLPIPILDGSWLMRPGESMPLVVCFSLGPFAIGSSMAKLPVWRLLPVSRRQIGRAQWWLGFGGPVIFLLLGVALAVVVTRLSGVLRASPSDILALAGGECAVGVLLPTIVLGLVLRERLGGTATVLLSLLGTVVVGAAMVAVAFARPTLTPGLRLALPVAGGTAIAVVIAVYLASPMIGAVAGAGPARDRARRPLRAGMKGWAGLWPQFLWPTAFAAVLSTGIFLVMRMLSRHADATADQIAAAWGVGVLTLMPLIFGGMARISARVLRGLPISAGGLALILLGAVTAAQLLAFAALYLVCRIWHGPADAVLALVPMAAGFGACGLALTLRGRGWVTGLIWLVIMPLGGLSFDHPALAAAVMAAGAVSLPTGWLWVFLELSRGRSAYAPSPISVLSWRGR